ncbi:ciliary neurotrophic factor isoform X2 [Kryptolebias marmoratus]|uniref:Ciliary neurotrophic factor n=1 Tax=Kryptolebias marmoratus TaxID=37003 RepID=A0A3Q3ED60_KRYMA|nr:ciliary neurotrophic factor isoform X2 [Kryptolebias marmoratus]
MAGTRTRAAAVAALLQEECSNLLALYREKEDFPVDVAEVRLVPVAPPSSQLDTRDKLLHLHSALLQCHTLLERAITKEDEMLGGGEKGKYEKQREMVKNRLSHLIISTGELLKAADGSPILIPHSDDPEPRSPTVLFKLKLWIYQIYKEVDHWTKAVIATLKELPAETDRKRKRIMPATRSARITRSMRR